MDLVRQSLAITFVFVLLCAALWLLRRKGLVRNHGNKTNRGLLESCGKLSLTAQHSVHLVRIGDRKLALAVHPAGITLLGDATLGAPGEPQDGCAP
jgi:flagellar biosynthetic protein FliO